MKLQDAYVEVAERSLEAADLTLGKHLPETSHFFSYHAFESLGGALCVSRGEVYSASHKKKLNQFTTMAKRLRRGYALTVAELSIQLVSLRNRCLYPHIEADGSVKRPQDIITYSAAKKIYSRVRGLLGKIRKDV